MEHGRAGRVTVIVNPSAGSGGGTAEARVREALSAEGLVATIWIAAPADVPDAARRAARDGAIVGVAGGDGTLSGAAAAIAEVGGVLAPFPLGTRNHFARRLGIDSPEAAARAIALGRVASVPVGSVNGRVFINHASAGIYPRLVWHRERIRRWTGKPLANVLAGLYAVLRMNVMRLAIRVNGSTFVRSVPGLWIALGRGAFRLPVDGHAPGGRNLEVIVANTSTRLAFVLNGLRALWRFRRGAAVDLDAVDVIHTPEFSVQARHPIDISRDGEVERTEAPIVFRMHPEALRVLSLVHEGEAA